MKGYQAPGTRVSVIEKGMDARAARDVDALYERTNTSTLAAHLGSACRASRQCVPNECTSFSGALAVPPRSRACSTKISLLASRSGRRTRSASRFIFSTQSC